MNNIEKMEKIGEGTYGVVFKGRNRTNGKFVAVKQIRLKLNNNGIPAFAMREIATLRELMNPNIVCLENVVMTKNELFMIFEFLTMDLKRYIDSMPQYKFMDAELIRSYMNQITSAIQYCHNRCFLHRDLKPQNLLINEQGVIKVADFGLCRSFNSALRIYNTNEICTLWYRAPEILLRSSTYSCPIDIWAIGCIFAEMVTKQPLFQGDLQIDQLFRIFRTLSTPTEEIWPGVTSLPYYNKEFPCWPTETLRTQLPNLNENGIDLILKMLTYDPGQRISAAQILKHPYFQD